MSDSARIFRQIGRALVRGLEGLGRLFTFAVKGAARSTRASRLKKSIVGRGRDTDKVYRELGRAYYELFGDAPADELREFCEQIDDNRAAQAEARERIADLNRAYEAERAGARDEARARREADRAAAEREKAEAAEERRIREEAARRDREEAEADREDDGPDVPSFMTRSASGDIEEEPTIRFEPAHEPEVRRFEAAVPERPVPRAAVGGPAGETLAEDIIAEAMAGSAASEDDFFPSFDDFTPGSGDIAPDAGDPGDPA